MTHNFLVSSLWWGREERQGECVCWGGVGRMGRGRKKIGEMDSWRIKTFETGKMIKTIDKKNVDRYGTSIKAG